MASRDICRKTFKLNNGIELPAVGLGTSQVPVGISDEEELTKSFIHAIHSGYRFFDTAQLYGMESAVGRAVRESKVPRSEITILTKFPPWCHHDPEASLNASLEALGVDYVDIFTLHWPMSETPDRTPIPPAGSPTFVEVWKKMEALVGPKCKAIGVNNFTQKTLETLLETATIVPVVNQVELHALNPNLKLVPYCKSKGIQVISWRTMGGMGTPNDPLVHKLFTDIAQAHQVSPAIVSLSWAVQRGIAVIPKSNNLARIEDNIKLVELTEEEMNTINSAHETLGKYRIAEYIPILQYEVDGKPTIRGWSKAELGWEDESGNWLT